MSVDSQISYDLALALGHSPEDVLHVHGPYTRVNQVEVRRRGPGWQSWQRFDYRDPRVAWPIAERFAFPRPCQGKWRCWINGSVYVTHDTAFGALALAVIKAHKEFGFRF